MCLFRFFVFLLDPLQPFGATFEQKRPDFVVVAAARSRLGASVQSYMSMSMT